MIQGLQQSVILTFSLKCVGPTYKVTRKMNILFWAPEKDKYILSIKHV